MKSPSAIRLVTSSAQSVFIHLQCHVKPGASKPREGILSISEDVIEVCVAAQAKDGEANKAVRGVFSDALKCPKSDVKVIRGLKSRDKTIAIGGIDLTGDGSIFIKEVWKQLQDAIDSH